MTHKTEILSQALTTRCAEVEEYQINIDNFTRAIRKIDAEYSNNNDMLVFRDQLVQLLEDNKREQLKAIIIRDVIAEQLNEMETAS